MHRRWALRFFMVVSANLFIRLAFFSSQTLFGAAFGFDPTTFRGPLLTSLVFGQYLVPLAVLELYFRAQDGAGALARIPTASLLFVLTLAMTAAMAILGFAVWAPQIQSAFDTRKSIAQAL